MIDLKPQHLLNRIARERGLSCCHDGACIYGHPGGMQTNGGCQALKERDVPSLRRHVQALRSIALELAARVINGQQPIRSPWRSLKDDPPTVGNQVFYRVRDGLGFRAYGVLTVPFSTSSKTTTGWDYGGEWMEVPE